MVPKNMQGSILYPLNMLAQKMPEIYAQNISKYIGREHITKQRIPILNCLWNDVLHLSPVHPKDIKNALLEIGYKAEFTINSYEITPEDLIKENTIVYLNLESENKDKMRTENFTSYNSDVINKYNLIPQSTKDYFKKIINAGGRPLIYHNVPHVFYKGLLDISKAKIISV